MFQIGTWNSLSFLNITDDNESLSQLNKTLKVLTVLVSAYTKNTELSRKYKFRGYSEKEYRGYSEKKNLGFSVKKRSFIKTNTEDITEKNTYRFRCAFKTLLITFL